MRSDPQAQRWRVFVDTGFTLDYDKETGGLADELVHFVPRCFGVLWLQAKRAGIPMMRFA